jgi:acetylglutamate kinase
MDKLKIFKVGGKVVEDPESLSNLLDMLITVSGYKILVHGGGPAATNLANKLGIKTEMVNGRRITGKEMLNVVTMVYAGLINKNIVAGLQARGCNALGLTGADMNLITAVKRPVEEIDYGFAGDVKSINTRELRLLINENIVPVIAPLTHDNKGTLLNTNADTIASAVAVELTAYFDVHLFYCFEKSGVLRNPEDDSSVIDYLDMDTSINYREEGVISKGMIPKLENGFRAKQGGVKEVLITSAAQIATGKGTRLL